jgi:hypothetical protein
MEIRCARCQVRHVGTCRKCHIGRCTQCHQAEEQCEVCDVSTKSTPNPGGSHEQHSPPALDGKRKKGVEAIRSVNMHQLGVNFVERVPDVRDDTQTRARQLPQENRWNSWRKFGDGNRRSESREKHNCYSLTDLGYELRWSTQQEPTFSSSRKHKLRRRPRSKETKDGGIKCGQA